MVIWQKKGKNYSGLIVGFGIERGSIDGLLLAVNCNMKKWKWNFFRRFLLYLLIYKPHKIPHTNTTTSNYIIRKKTMATLTCSSLKNSAFVLILVYALTFSFSLVSARPATFLQDFKIAWSDSHIKQLDGGRGIQLILDQNSGIILFKTLSQNFNF